MEIAIRSATKLLGNYKAENPEVEGGKQPRVEGSE